MNLSHYPAFFVLASSCLVDNVIHAGGVETSKSSLAICVTGDAPEAGVLHRGLVHGSIAFHLFRGLGASRIDLFAVLNVGSEREAFLLKEVVSGFLGAQSLNVNVSEQVRSMPPCTHEKEYHPCLAEFVQMWVGVEKCFEQVRDAERSNGWLYTWVLRIRPDIFWHTHAPKLTSFDQSAISSGLQSDAIFLSPRVFADVAFRGVLKFHRLFQQEHLILPSCFDGEAIFENALANHNIPLVRRPFGGVIVRRSPIDDQIISDCSEVDRETSSHITEDACRAILYGGGREAALLAPGAVVQSDNECASLNVVVTSKVLVLTPLKNAAAHLPNYAKKLRNLSYPHELISVAFLVSDSSDATEMVARSLERGPLKSFADVSVFVKNFMYGKPKDRHAFSNQTMRRKVLARSRNELMKMALKDDVFGVFWIDVDIGIYPSTLIQDLMSLGHPIVAPHVKVGEATFDLNTWRENKPEAAFVDFGNPDVLFEGYEADLHDQGSRHHMDDLEMIGNAMGAGPNKFFAVAIHGVGTALLYVEARVHREAGIVFPEKPYKHRLESEGFGLLALDHGFHPCGLPNYIVYHHDAYPAPPIVKVRSAPTSAFLGKRIVV